MGTILRDADLSRLADYLNPDEKKLQAKGITSVRSRVTNLQELVPDITFEQICSAIIRAFFAHFGEECQPEHISPASLPDLPGFEAQFAKQSSWQWNFGQAPQFQHLLDTRFRWGGVEIHVDVERGKISRCQIFSDSLNLAPLEKLAERLPGTEYRPQALADQVAQLKREYPQQAAELAELEVWLAESIR